MRSDACWFLVLFFSLFSCNFIQEVEAGIPFRRSKSLVKKKSTLDIPNVFYPWADDNDEFDHPSLMFGERVWMATKASAMAAYGTNLLFFSSLYPGQIHIMTMMRATGFDKIDKMITTTRENIRAAVWKAIWNSPTFWKAKRNYRDLHSRTDGIRKILLETKKAKADGIVTAAEAKRIKKIREKEVREYQKEMIRLKKAGNSLKKVWEALDVDEIQDVVKGFLFQMMAVLASGHNDSIVGKAISKWCLFLNLGSLFLDVNRKLHFPLSKLLLNKSLSSKSLTPEKAKQIETMAQVIMFAAAGYMTLYRTPRARQLNASLMSSAVIFKGLRVFVEAITDKHDDRKDSLWSTGDGFLQGHTGGLLMVGLTSFGMTCRLNMEAGTMTAPAAIVKPFRTVEDTIDRMVLVLDKIV